MAASAAGGLTTNYITPYALTMQATTQQIGFLTSIPNFATMLALLWTPLLAERARSRKAFIIPIDLFLYLLWLPILLVPFLFHTGQVWWLIVLVTLSTVAGNIIGAPWSAMMADLVPPEIRGSYFGLRNGIGNLVTLIFSFVAGGLLQILTGNTRLAFAIIFAGALVSTADIALLSFFDAGPPSGLCPKILPARASRKLPGDYFRRISGALSFLLFS